MKYTAKFGIDGGVSHGYGLKSPDYIKKEENFELEGEKANNENALGKAAIIAYKLSRNHLSNPETDETKVTLLNLLNEKRELISQKDFVSEYGGFNFENGKSLSFSVENDKMVFTCSTLEHLLSLGK